MADRVQAPPDLLLAGASTEHWRTPSEIHQASGVSTSVISARALGSKLAALVRRGELEKRPVAEGSRAQEYRRRESSSWWRVDVEYVIRAPTEAAAEHRITDRIDSREIPGLFPVATVRVLPSDSPMQRLEQALERTANA